MSQVWLILKKDLRRLWPMLLLLYVASAVSIAAALHGVLGSGLFSIESLPAASVYWLTLLITAQLVQQDRLVGGSAFWMTRPIRRSALFSSKLLFLIVFVLPVPAAAPWVSFLQWDVAGWGFESAWLVDAFPLVAMVTAGFAVAAVAKNLLLSFCYLIGWVVPFIKMRGVFLGRAVGYRDDYGALNGEAAMFLAWLAWGASVACHHYLTGKTRRSIQLAFGGAIVAAVLILPMWDVHGWLHPLPADRIVVELEASRWKSVRRDDYLRGERVMLPATPVVDAHPRGERIEFDDVLGDMRLPNGQTAEITSGLGKTRGTDVEAVFPGYRWISRSSDRFDSVSLWTPYSNMASLAAGPVDLSLRATGVAYRAELVGMAPLEEGAHVRHGSTVYTVESVRRYGDHVELRICHRMLISALRPGLTARFVLVHANRKEVVGRRPWHFSSRIPLGMHEGVANVEHGRNPVHFERAAIAEDGSRWRLDDDWFDGARLAFLQPIPVRKLEVEMRGRELRFWDGRAPRPPRARADGK